MKILVFAEVYFPDVIGGGEFSTKLMTEGMVSRGHDVEVYCLGKNDTDEEINGVRIHRKYIKYVTEHVLSMTKNNQAQDTLSAIKKILSKRVDIYYDKKWYEYYLDIIIAVKPDVIHSVAAMSYLGRINLWKAAFDAGVPMSHVCRSPNLIEFQFLGGKLNKYYIGRNALASKYLTALAAPSKYMLECHTKAGIKGRKLNSAIYNAVDFPAVEPSDDQISSKNNFILYAGDIRKEKGILTLIKAVRGIPDVKLLLIGKGELSSSIIQDEKVKLIDWLDKDTLYKYMQTAKIIVLPSEWNEAFGRILIEGINNCTIGVGSDRGGIPEVLGFNSDYIYQSGDATELKNKLLFILSFSKEKYIEEIKKQQKYVEQFSIENYISNWEKFFTQQLL